MESNTIITILVIGIVISKIIIGILIYELVRKNRILKNEKTKFLISNFELKSQAEKIRKYNDDLQASELFKIKVLSIASHDLRTPFASMDMLLNFGDLSILSKQDLEQILLGLREQVSISQQMLDEVLLWAASQLRDNIENKEIFNVSEQIKHIQVLFKSEMQEKKIVLRNDVPQSSSIHMSKDIFSFVVRNILSNAVKFCKPEGIIMIASSEVKKGKFELVIKNEGENIREAILDRLNNVSSYENKRIINDKGAGLGVSLCKDLLQRVGGSIHYENLQDVGTIVHILFPPHSFSPTENTIKNINTATHLIDQKKSNVTV